MHPSIRRPHRSNSLGPRATILGGLLLSSLSAGAPGAPGEVMEYYHLPQVHGQGAGHQDRLGLLRSQILRIKDRTVHNCRSEGQPQTSILNPQRWNRYAYGLNNPRRFNDPDGREVPVVVDGRMYNMGLEGPPPMSRQEATMVALLYGGAFLGGLGLAVAPVMPAAAVEAQIAAGSCVASPGCQNAVRGMAERMSGAAPGSIGTVTAFESKAAARAAIAAMDLPEAQAGAAMRAIQRATTTSTIEIGTQESGSLVVSVSRAGRDGRQVMENVISPQGTTTVVQKAFDAPGKLVHDDPKTP